MKTKLLLSALCLALAFSVRAAELKPYQKEALKKLEITFGGSWPLVRKQYETAIAEASEQEVMMIVDMTVGARKNGAPGGPAPASSGDDDLSLGENDYDRAQAAREDLEKQISKPYNDFIELVIRIGGARGRLSDEIRNDIFRSEKGGRLQGLDEYMVKSPFVTNRSIAAGMEAVRGARQKLVDSKKFYKVTFPSSLPLDNNSRIEPLVREAGEKVKALNIKYGLICIDIKKRMDAIPYGGGVDVNKRMGELYAERAAHDKSLSAEVKVIVDDLNRRIAELDQPLFDWALKPLREAQPQSGPVASR